MSVKIFILLLTPAWSAPAVAEPSPCDHGSIRVKPALYISLFGFFGPMLTTFKFSFGQCDCHLVPGGQFIFIPYLYNPPPLPKDIQNIFKLPLWVLRSNCIPRSSCTENLISKFTCRWCVEVIRSEWGYEVRSCASIPSCSRGEGWFWSGVHVFSLAMSCPKKIVTGSRAAMRNMVLTFQHPGEEPNRSLHTFPGLGYFVLSSRDTPRQQVQADSLCGHKPLLLILCSHSGFLKQQLLTI